ncbi:hypothetical protein BJY52DRAFT_128223 [Lactarius psammicola]|nr:hypothetical protein BJY52DRAFT_128223 [Lactarius psammicola]
MPSGNYFESYSVTVYATLFVGIVYGVYIVLYITSVYILLGKPGFTSSRPRMFMFGITTFMFILGIVALVIETAIVLQPLGSSAQSYSTKLITMAIITRLMYILSDVICAWRAVVLWNRHKCVIAILLLFIFGTIAAAGCELGLSLITNTSQGETVGLGPLIMVGPTLATNLLSTGLIAWKAWQHRTSIRKHLGEGSGSMRVERVFALLIESGFLYCCPWILYLISARFVIPQPGFSIMDRALVFVSGLYPMLIIILVAMQKSPVEHYSTYSAGMQFASGPAPRPPSAGDMSQHVCMIHREYTSDSDMQVPFMVFMKPSDEAKSP